MLKPNTKSKVFLSFNDLHRKKSQWLIDFDLCYW